MSEPRKTRGGWRLLVCAHCGGDLGGAGQPVFASPDRDLPMTLLYLHSAEPCITEGIARLRDDPDGSRDPQVEIV